MGKVRRVRNGNPSSGSLKGSANTVLVALCGRSPAVITETVWALSRETPPILPQRVVVLTTLPGREDIRKQLLQSGVWGRLRAVLHAPEHCLCFGDTGDSIRVFPSSGRTRELRDIADTADSEAAADFILDSLRQFTENPTVRVVVSVAGGRKTMSVLAGLCLTLLGRQEDRLCHVLVNPPFDSPDLRPRFYFPDPEVKQYRLPDGTDIVPDTAEVRLCEIPFVRFRYLYHQHHARYPGTFADTVELANMRITEAIKPPTLYLAPGEVGNPVCRVDDIDVPLSAAEFTLCWMLAQRRIDGEPPIQGQDSLADAFGEFATGVSREIMPEIIHHDRFREKWGTDAVEPGKSVRQLAYSLGKKLSKALDGNQRIEPCLPRRGKGIYGLALPPEAITIDVP